MIVVQDTNLLARASISRNTAVSARWDLWLANGYTLVVSAHILGELMRTLAKPYFAARLPPVDQVAYQSLLATQAQHVAITAQVQGVATHPEDDLVLATAVSAQADYLLTRDGKLLALGAYQGVRIVSPTELLRILQP